MRALYAVYQYGWTNSQGWFEPVLANGRGPSRALLGVCRTRAKAVLIAARISRLVPAAARSSRSEDGPAIPLIGVVRYDPHRFLTVREFPGEKPTRAEAHRRLMAAAKVWRARLGLD